MNNMKNVLLIILFTVGMFIFSGCEIKQAKQNWEYTIVLFSREDTNMYEELQKLGSEGWEYAGPLANNGINAQYVAFKRPIK